MASSCVVLTASLLLLVFTLQVKGTPVREDSTEYSAEDSIEDAMKDSTEAAMEDSSEESIEDSTEDSTEDSMEDAMEDSTEDSMEDSIEDSIDDETDDDYQTQIDRMLSGQCPVVDCQVFEEILQCPYSERVGTSFMSNGVKCLGCRECSADWTRQHVPQDGAQKPEEEEDSETSGEISEKEGKENSSQSEEADVFMNKAKDLFKKSEQVEKSAVLIEGDSRVVRDLMQFLKNAVGSKLSMRVLA
ncbi:hypothetical protein CAPTEDRAFT_221240 [Capitella teleta]|uniref:Uncharacterized protein n=1 Tax=Capitella teleta TaxID=283909 RepID=R7VEL0_CAPTE|nr:hypothetical protein CAPTEDRAFT_221240 [Capitella teleta]|eukprot:ELU17268.1 hypothetical protein CAPTEDRAFT_221240 [Capitella teleta]